ncbi:hypothetical protein DBR44_11805 [Aquitalea sp. FJL05]|uniref:hypothetical protein n=1 Tax=Aquitalea TaxID=407217 RepID=UPI000F5A77D6|nr:MULTISPECIES: hypothetical protein [Aquitalea]RQO71126.1 hypothetical protein DBR44_11805 [Aquitalea sp. FJL05]
MHKFIIMLAGLLSSSGAYADSSFSLLLSGASIHSGCQQGKGEKAKSCEFNNNNPGLGLEWAFAGNEDNGRWFTRVATYRDSFEQQAWYVSAGYRKEWRIIGPVYLGAGVQAGYLDGSGIKGLAALPMISLGSKDVALEIGYAPKTNTVGQHKRVNVTTFSLRWSF